MTRATAPDRTLSASGSGRGSNAPIERVAIADGHFHLPNAEYARCWPPADIACGCCGPGQLIVGYTASKPTDWHRRLCERRCRPECASRAPVVLKEDSTHVRP